MQKGASSIARHNATLAQLVEHQTEDLGVPGSSPGGRTIQESRDLGVETQRLNNSDRLTNLTNNVNNSVDILTDFLTLPRKLEGKKVLLLLPK